MILVFSDDWGRHPSSCQHLVKCLLPRHRVTWVNTIGMRSPGFNPATMRRAAERIGQWMRPRRAKADVAPAAANPVVLNPRMWPWFTRRYDRWLNQLLLNKALQPVVQNAGEPVYAVTSIPIAADLMKSLPVARWTYYCVDDFGSWPGLDQRTMENMEREVIEQADTIIAAGENLHERIRARGRTAQLLTHGVDLPFWEQARDANFPFDVAMLPRPLVVFWGLLDARLNAAWIERLSRDLTTGTILLVGPQDQPPEQLRGLANVTVRPAVPYESLPALGQAADVLIMPYDDLPVTRAMQPLKLKEYLATGKPVVVSDLPATRDWSDCLDLATSAEAFAALVRERCTGGLPVSQRAARSRLQSESWSAKALKFESWVLGSDTAAASANEVVP